MEQRTFRILGKWLNGLILSCFVIWGITAIFTENVFPSRWSEQLGRNIPSAGSTFQGRREGWGESRFGELGLPGTEFDEIATEDKLVIWGDSFVEAFHVDDAEKMHSQLNSILAADRPSSLHAVGVGESWWSVADYRFRIPDYEAALGQVRLHVIHLFTLEDVMPDQYPGARVSLFLSKPSLQFEKYDNEYHELEAPKVARPMRDAFYQARLQFFFQLKSKIVRVARFDGLRFSPGQQQHYPATTNAHRAWNRFLDPEWVNSPPPVAAWTFVLEELTSATDLPILFVYAPVTPTLERGTMMETNPESALASAFADLCKTKGIGFTSLEKSLLRHLKDTGKFPKGFHNSRPWEGHYNADGHRLAAEAIHAWISENRHVVYPD